MVGFDYRKEWGDDKKKNTFTMFNPNSNFNNGSWNVSVLYR